ncbi:MAG: MFS transporter [Hyphomicrobiaceae bacterium]|nr:MAG: MFS transporter [Hyphomicrobiaceae bacterium]
MGLSKRGYAVRVALLYGGMFFVAGIHLPYLPAWLEWRGLPPESIALILALPPLVRTFFTPIFAAAADRFRDPRHVLVALGIAAGLAYASLVWANGFWVILAIIVFYAMVGPAMMPLAEVVALKGVKAGLDYGRMRTPGSLTFIGANIIGGYAIARAGPEAVPYLLALGSLALVAAAAAQGRLMDETASAAGEEQPARAGLLEGLGELARARAFWIFLVAASATGTSHALIYAFGTVHWLSQSISPATTGLLWAIGVIAEVVLFLFSRVVVERVGAVTLIVIGGTAAIVRWGLMAFDPPVAALFLLQALHGATFGAAHLGAMHFIARAIPERLGATAQGVYSATTGGIVMAAMFFLSGRLYGQLGGRAYLAMAVLGLIGAAAALLLSRVWNGRRLIEDTH